MGGIVDCETAEYLRGVGFFLTQTQQRDAIGGKRLQYDRRITIIYSILEPNTVLYLVLEIRCEKVLDKIQSC